MSNYRHGHKKAGSARTPTYVSWVGMLQRCTNPQNPAYERYKHLAIDPRWHRFALFLGDMGFRPPGTTLDRIDNTKGYCKENCRWALPTVQARNRKSTRLTADDVVEIRRQVSLGDGHALVAKRFNVSVSNISKIATRKNWSEL